MGDVVDQNRAYTIQVLHKLLEMYETEYRDLRSNMSMVSLNACIFLLLTCLGGMRRFEAVWTDLGGTLIWCGLL